MRAYTAATLLNVEADNTSPEEVRARAAEAIRLAHPDNGGDPQVAAAQIKRAKAARDVLLAHLESPDPTRRECPVCAGTGELSSKAAFKTQKCPRCKGSGWVDL